MFNIRPLTVGLLVLACISQRVCAQHSDWTIKYWEGKSGELITLANCKLISVTADSLNVELEGSNRSVRLFLLHQLSRPNEEHDAARPIWMGAAFGGVFGFVATSVTMGDIGSTNNDDVDPRLAVAALFTLVGGGLGFAESVGSETVRYRFGEITNPEKRTAVEKIIEEEKMHFSDGKHIE